MSIVTLDNALVTRYAMQPADAEPALIEERVWFNFQTIKFNYDHTHEVEFDLRNTK